MKMSAPKRKGPIIDPGLCRCCGVAKKCRLINVEYNFFGQTEVYSDMFLDCFGLLLSHLDSGPEDRCICATCVMRLRDATSFRQQVLQCEERLLHVKILMQDSFNEEHRPINDNKDNLIKTETEVKEEVEVKTKRELDQKTMEKVVATLPTDNIPDDDCIDSLGNENGDTMSVKSEELLETKPIKKPVKRKKKTLKMKSSKSKSARKLAKELKEAKRKLQNIKQDEEMDIDILPKPPPRKKVLDNDHKSFRNTLTIVENSYVCPFDTSFSDYFCIYCRQRFTDPEKLREHTLTHDVGSFKECVVNKKLIQIDVFRIDCRLCEAKIISIDSLKNHLKDAHSIPLYDIRNEFLKFRLTVNNLKCLVCEGSFSFFHALKKHMAEHFGTCICDVCGAHYFEERMLILHQKSHQKIEESHPCSQCGKVFKSKHSKYVHETSIHKKEPVYHCSKCDEVLFSYSLRYRHMMEVHGEHRLFRCDHCDRAYVSRKSLREHNRRFHLKVFKHQCDLCDKRFYLPSRLKEHLATHTGERNFRCEYCGKSYPRLRSLKVHMQSHGGEKKFRCSICNAMFTQNFNLKNHMKRQHQSLEMEGYNE